MSLLARLLLVPLLVLPLVAQGAAGQVVRFPRPESESDRRYDYTAALLKLALSKAGPQYRIERAKIPMNQDRQVLELEAGRTIDVAGVPSSAEREARLLAVCIPITKGLLGWRLGLIRKGDAARFADVNTLEDLKRVRLGQAFEWPDVRILGANGVSVVTSPTYDGLFKMLDGRRFDFFPRTPLEIWDEQVVIELKNPLLTPGTPLDRPELWYDARRR